MKENVCGSFLQISKRHGGVIKKADDAVVSDSVLGRTRICQVKGTDNPGEAAARKSLMSRVSQSRSDHSTRQPGGQWKGTFSFWGELSGCQKAHGEARKGSTMAGLL